MKLVFMGSPDFAVPCLEAIAPRHEVVLVVTQPDKPAGRGGALASPAVKHAAERLGLPVLQPRSVRPPAIAETLRATGAALAVVVAYGKILPPAVLTAFPRGCINVHGSILPAYRGAAPIQWAVLDGRVRTGVTIMQLDEGMDTGPTLLVRELAIGAEETAGELFARMAPLGAAALIEALDGLEAGTLAARPQPPDGASHARMLTKADGAIDFARPAAVVAAHIRGVDPWPGAVASRRGELVKLFGAIAVPDDPAATTQRPASYVPSEAMTAASHGAGDVAAQTAAARVPGEVIAIDARGAHIAASDGVVVVRELQLAARKRLTAQALAAGRQLAVGDRFVLPAIAPSPA